MELLPLLVWFASAILTVFSIVATWFHSPVPVHVMTLLHWLGWRRSAEGFWPDEVETRTWLSHECRQWMAIRLPGWLGMLSCPWCMSWDLTLLVLVCSLCLFPALWWLCLPLSGSVPGLVWLLTRRNA